MYEISKEHKFEAAHRLVNGYEGKCAHVHGHSWVVHFICKGSSLDRYGMLRDFGSFKEFRKWIDDNLDHATIVSKYDTPLLIFLKENNQRYFEMEDNPTSEALSEFLFQKAKEFGIKEISAVSIFETCTSEAVYSEE